MRSFESFRLKQSKRRHLHTKKLMFSKLMHPHTLKTFTERPRMPLKTTRAKTCSSSFRLVFRLRSNDEMKAAGTGTTDGSSKIEPSSRNKNPPTWVYLWSTTLVGVRALSSLFWKVHFKVTSKKSWIKEESSDSVMTRGVVPEMGLPSCHRINCLFVSVMKVSKF